MFLLPEGIDILWFDQGTSKPLKNKFCGFAVGGGGYLFIIDVNIFLVENIFRSSG